MLGDHRPAVAVALAISLALPLVPLASDNAQAQECIDVREHPLWFRTVDIQEVGGDSDDTYLPGKGAAYVQEGTELDFEIEIYNRFPDRCPGSTDELVNDLRIRFEYHDIDDSNVDSPAISDQRLDCQNVEDASSDHIPPGEHCIQHAKLPTFDDEVKAAATDSGEQRLRFVVYDADADADGDGTLDDCAGDDEVGLVDAEGPQGACAGAERILVVDQLPDLTVSNVGVPSGDLYSSKSSTTTSVDVELKNVGDYPGWNPNGGRDGPAPYWEASSFDADGDGNPEEDGDNAYSETDRGPACKESLADWPDEDGSMVCSYRRGSLLQIPVLTNVTRSGGDEPVEAEVHDFYSSGEIGVPENDKNAALLNGETREVTYEILDRYKLAGDFDLLVEADPSDEGGFGNVPELNETNNSDTVSVNIKGVDLQIDNPSGAAIVETADGVTSCPESDPCPIEKDGEESRILLDPRIANNGDEVEGTEHDDLLNVDWRASVYLNQERIDGSDRDINLDSDFDTVPSVDEGTVDLYDFPREIAPRAAGGEHRVAVAIDNVENYETDWDDTVTDDVGRVGERNEGNGCPEEGEVVDNTYCISFWFVDVNPPDIQETRILREGPAGQMEPIEDGDRVVVDQPVTFEAEVEDPSLWTVTAVVNHTDDLASRELEMTQSNADEDRWNVSTTLPAPAGEYGFSVRAEDLNHTVWNHGQSFQLLDAWPDPSVSSLDVTQTDVGQHRIETDLTNVGDEPTGSLALQVRACPNDTLAEALAISGCEELFHGDLSALSAGETDSYELLWDTTSAFGEWRVVSELVDAGGLDETTANNSEDQIVRPKLG